MNAKIKVREESERFEPFYLGITVESVEVVGTEIEWLDGYTVSFACCRARDLEKGINCMACLLANTKYEQRLVDCLLFLLSFFL